LAGAAAIISAAVRAMADIFISVSSRYFVPIISVSGMRRHSAVRDETTCGLLIVDIDGVVHREP
jgi:hypothetical protein